MAQQSLPSTPELQTIKYENLLGVDFRADQTEVDRRRSPDMVNMISDIGGNPIKRYGYRNVGSAYAGLVNANSQPYGVRTDLTGLTIAPISIDATTKKIVEDTAKTITIPISSYSLGDITASFGYQKYVFVMCENGCVKADVTKYASLVESEKFQITGTGDGMMSVGAVGSTAPRCEAIVPISVIGLKPDATSGVSYYGKNLMSIYQQFMYAGDGTSTEFKIPLYAKMGAWAKVEVMDTQGNWVTKTLGTDYTLGTAETVNSASLDGETVLSASIVDAKITFTTAPVAPSTTLAGEDNVRITVAPFNNNDEDKMTIGSTVCFKGFYNETFQKLLDSKAQFFFEGRLFLGVVEKSYYSEVNNPFNLPDNFYFEVDNEIVCYQRVSSYLVLITKDTGVNTIFLANSTTTTDSTTGVQTTQFAVKPSNAGVGAITGSVRGVLNDEPMFLSSTGLYGILTNWNSEKYAVKRSERINRKLCKEYDLETAVGCAYNGYYYLAVNARMYILDGRHKDSTRSGETSYECYYFEDVPTVKSMFVADGRMYFTDETYTYTWNDDLGDALAYYDNLVLSNAGEYVSGTPVTAHWSTVFDDDNYLSMYKTLNKKGTAVTLVPHSSTGCYVVLNKDGDSIRTLDWMSSAIFTFELVDFVYNPENERFGIDFNSNSVAVDNFTRKKVKKYKRLQFKIVNDRPQPFGIVSLIKTYTYGNYAKR